jgi:hypothetical protein
MPPSLRAERSGPVGVTLRRVALPWSASPRVMTERVGSPQNFNIAPDQMRSRAPGYVRRLLPAHEVGSGWISPCPLPSGEGKGANVAAHPLAIPIRALIASASRRFSDG